MDSKVFGRFIAEIRKEKNMTQAELAGRIGVTDKAVSRWERGLGFPDINTLEPLAKALDLSVLELMRSRKSDMEENGGKKKDLSEENVLELMENAVYMSRENRKQDRVSVCLGGTVTIIAAVFVRMSGHANTGGALLVGGILALAVVAVYLYTQNIGDKDSRRIYGAFMMGALGLVIHFLTMLGVEPERLVWIVYAVFLVIVARMSSNMNREDK